MKVDILNPTMYSQKSSNEKKGNDSDDDWSDEDKSVTTTNTKPNVPVILQSGSRHPSGAVVKQANSRPPEVSRKAPVKPPPLISPSNMSTDGSVGNASTSNQPVASDPAPPPAAPIAPPGPPGPPAAQTPPPPPSSTQTAPSTTNLSVPPPQPSINTSTSTTSAELGSRGKGSSTEDKKEPVRVVSLAQREAERIAELEEEVQELRRKLERAEARLVSILPLYVQLFIKRYTYILIVFFFFSRLKKREVLAFQPEKQPQSENQMKLTRNQLR